MRLLSLVAAFLVAGLTLSACDAFDSGSDEARITVRLTDAPFPFDLADSANVTITRIELLAVAEADTAATDSTDRGDDRDVIVLFDADEDGEPFAFNLLDLRDGVTATLVDGLAIPHDRPYEQIRVYVGDDASVVFNDGSEYNLKLPSAQQSGIKINLPDYSLDGAGEEIDLLIDFNVEESFVTRGNPNSANFQGFLFKPVLKVESFEIVPSEEETGDEETEGGDGSEGGE